MGAFEQWLAGHAGNSYTDVILRHYQTLEDTRRAQTALATHGWSALPQAAKATLYDAALGTLGVAGELANQWGVDVTRTVGGMAQEQGALQTNHDYAREFVKNNPTGTARTVADVSGLALSLVPGLLAGGAGDAPVALRVAATALSGGPLDVPIAAAVTRGAPLVRAGLQQGAARGLPGLSRFAAKVAPEAGLTRPAARAALTEGQEILKSAELERLRRIDKAGGAIQEALPPPTGTKASALPKGQGVAFELPSPLGEPTIQPALPYGVGGPPAGPRQLRLGDEAAAAVPTGGAAPVQAATPVVPAPPGMYAAGHEGAGLAGAAPAPPDADLGALFQRLESDQAGAALPSVPTPPSVGRLSAAREAAFGDRAGRLFPVLANLHGLRIGPGGTAMLGGTDATEFMYAVLESPKNRALMKAADATYGDKVGHAFPALLKRHGATLATDGTITRAGQDVTAPLLSYLADTAGVTKTTERAARAAQLEDEMRALLPGAGDIAAGGGGGGLGIAAKLPPARFTLGAAAGGAGGALAGAQVEADSPEDRARNIAIGLGLGTIGGGVGGDWLGRSAYGQATALGLKKGLAQHQLALKEGTFTPGLLISDLARSMIHTPGGLALDEISNFARSLAANIPWSEVNRSRGQLTKHWVGGTERLYDDEIANLFTSVGRDASKVDWAQQLGNGFLNAATEGGKKLLHPLAAALSGAAQASLGAGAVLPVAGHLFGAARGFTREIAAEMFRNPNEIAQFAARNAAYRREASVGLSRAARVFKETLAGAGASVGALDDAGRFSAAEVEALAPGAGHLWDTILDRVLGTAPALEAGATKATPEAIAAARGTAAKSVVDNFGDYATKSALSKAMQAATMFSTYALGQYPVLARLVARHPLPALMIGRYLADDRRAARREGRPTYLQGTVPIPTETPVLGGLIQAEMGGREGTGRLSPFSAALGVTGEQAGLLAGDQPAGNQPTNVFTVADRILGVAGLSLSPIVGAVGYTTGQTDQAPNFSRTAGIERALPGPETGTLTGVLRGAREKITGKADTYDPVALAAKELIFRQTGKVASDPSNKAVAQQLRDPNSPLMKEAKGMVRSGDWVKNLVSIVSPLRPQTTTQEKEQYRQSLADQPGVAPADRTGAAAMYASPDFPRGSYAASGKLRDPRLVDFMNKYDLVRREHPEIYAELLRRFEQATGIKADK